MWTASGLFEISRTTSGSGSGVPVIRSTMVSWMRSEISDVHGQDLGSLTWYTILKLINVDTTRLGELRMKVRTARSRRLRILEIGPIA